MKRAYFIGAGASCADGFPLTAELLGGIIATSLPDAFRYKRVVDFLQIVFALPLPVLTAAANAWETLKKEGRSAERISPPRLPDISELLSLLDILIGDESVIATTKNAEQLTEPISTREMHRIRESIIRALARSLTDFATSASTTARPLTADLFAASLGPDDTVMTTNWDLLLDQALDARFGTDASSVGTDAVIVRNGVERPVLPRPPLYKLHGSLNWLYCLRCQMLFVDPTGYVGDRGFYHSARGSENTCRCGMPLRSTLITPTYFKEYRTRHLANIWSAAQHHLAESDEWIFIGYSLPRDDVHIRALLLKAWHARRDAGGAAPHVTLVTDRVDEATLARYAGLFAMTCIDSRGFREYVAVAAP